MFDFTPVGLAVAIAGVAFVTVVGWRLLPVSRRSRRSTAELFDIENYVAEVRVPEDSPAVGKTVAEIETESQDTAVVVGLIRNRRRMYASASRETIRADDILIVEAGPEGLDKFVSTMKLELAGSEEDRADSLRTRDTTLIEAVVTPRSRLIGRIAGDLHLRTRYGINLLAVSREGRPFRERVRQVRFQAGDVLLVQGDAEQLPEVIATLGSKEGFANMAQAITAPGDVILCPNPSYPIHAFGFTIAGASVRSVPLLPVENLIHEIERACRHSAPRRRAGRHAGMPRSGPTPIMR